MAWDKLTHLIQALWASVPLYNLSLNLTKASMVLLYLRLFPLRTYQIILYTVLIFVIITGLWMVFASFFMCIPIRGAWDISSPHNCIPKEVLWSLNAALQIITDMTIVILPMPLLAKLQLPRKQKIALILVFALGTLFVYPFHFQHPPYQTNNTSSSGCAVSIVRLTALVQMIQSTDRTSTIPDTSTPPIQPKTQPKLTNNIPQNTTPQPQTGPSSKAASQ
ncbi:unnamed protein product [Aspergillus oryzae]|uniref:Unnamed protein product n=2 Tax=Aspergillus oryzae TaxID=5062 RepID=A0AAN5BZC2_ASPOZ|nr:unnamed protein product [Aspergillus oryzae]GMF94690.1 unnamed protein product [Aspergillus oryzae]GMG06902.1 unnamed protein product [Aspergillus oryzae]GMG32662.1 unnamed protein product [Aspergillus oryzae]GMG49981.1 unnamed protein product [Aspergillus oryzae var. brunneus]